MKKTSINELIVSQIQAQGGKIPFPLYMELALYAPEVGYYTNGLPKFGPAGDFITAPELTPLFGQTLCHAIPDFTHVLELGAGSGALAKTLLDMHKNIEKYWIFEVSDTLKERQKNTLKDHLSKITWLTALPCEKFTGVIIANEVIDAFPVTKFLWKDNTVYEYFVACIDHTLRFVTEPTQNKILNDFVTQLHLPDNYSSEIHLNLNPWLKTLSDSLQKGLMLIIDYGFPRHEFYHPDRSMGTIMCHSQHRSHSDPLYNPGHDDITAHVDFTALAEAAVENQLEVAGYTSQAAFLLENGLLNLAKNAQDNQNIKILTHPNEMGELFKVMALTKDWDKPISGFRMHDRVNRL